MQRPAERLPTDVVHRYTSLINFAPPVRRALDLDAPAHGAPPAPGMQSALGGGVAASGAHSVA
jgi:hypothetical protein